MCWGCFNLIYGIIMHPIFCIRASSGCFVFGCMFEAPHFLLLLRLSFPSSCLLLVGRQKAGSSPGFSAAFLPGRKLLHAVMQQNLCSWAGCSPNSCLGDTLSCVIRNVKVSSCSPDASLCGSHGWERKERAKTMAMSYWNRLSPKARAERISCCPS